MALSRFPEGASNAATEGSQPVTPHDYGYEK
jgi:hypothetical protein